MYFFFGYISLYVFKSKIVRDLGLSRVGVFLGECDEIRGVERSWGICEKVKIFVLGKVDRER